MVFASIFAGAAAMIPFLTVPKFRMAVARSESIHLHRHFTSITDVTVN